MNYIIKNVVLEKRHLKIIRDTVSERSLGSRGDSIALRQIIDEWAEFKKQKDNGNKENRANS